MLIKPNLPLKVKLFLTFWFWRWAIQGTVSCNIVQNQCDMRDSLVEDMPGIVAGTAYFPKIFFGIIVQSR